MGVRTGAGDLGSQEFVGDVVVNGAASFNGAVVNQTFPGGSPLAGVDAPLLPGSGVSSAAP